VQNTPCVHYLLHTFVLSKHFIFFVIMYPVDVKANLIETS
jgi:hypothetical protein